MSFYMFTWYHILGIHGEGFSSLPEWCKYASVNYAIIGSDNGLSPRRRQAIIWTNARILSIGPFGINFSEILIEIHTFLLKKIHLKMLSGKWRPFCVGLNVLNSWHHFSIHGQGIIAKCKYILLFPQNDLTHAGYITKMNEKDHWPFY